MLSRELLAALALLGLLLALTIVPGVFTVDEDHYLVTVTALRQGRLTVPGTEELTASRELRWFDPEGPYRAVARTPVSATVPPLYAPIALPFSWLGWRGLVLLNILSFLVATAVVATSTARYAAAPAAGWLAAATFALGGYALEYAGGVWPHMLAAALVVGAAALTARVRDGAGTALAGVAGLLAGVATGVRYQEIVAVAGLGLGVWLWSPRRWRSSAAYALGAGLPLLANAALNHARLGFWNPISKGPGYLHSGAPRGRLLHDTLTMAWARIGDFSTRPPLAGSEHAAYLHPDPVTGAYMVGAAMKKAWLQSCPWIALALALLVICWSPHAEADTTNGTTRRRELRAISLVVLPTLLLFAASGTNRTDGLGFNQRYFIELVPLVAIVFGWACTSSGPLRLRPLLAGGAGGALLAGASLVPPPSSSLHQIALLYLPLFLALALLLAWVVARRRSAAALWVCAGLALGWAATVHLGDDLPAARRMRRQNAARTALLAPRLPDRSALFTWWGNKDALGPLLLDRDLVVLDVRNDEAETAPRLADELAARGRRIFVLPYGMSPAEVRRIAGDRGIVGDPASPVALLELVAPGPS